MKYVVVIMSLLLLVGCKSENADEWNKAHGFKQLPLVKDYNGPTQGTAAFGGPATLEADSNVILQGDCRVGSGPSAITCDHIDMPGGEVTWDGTRWVPATVANADFVGQWMAYRQGDIGD